MVRRSFIKNISILCASVAISVSSLKDLAIFPEPELAFSGEIGKWGGVQLYYDKKFLDSAKKGIKIVDYDPSIQSATVTFKGINNA